jgi:DNA-binding response OmpR family regulator
MRILVAEDHPTLGSSLKEGLEECYYAVDLVTDGEEAYELGRVIHYDLIVLDIMLPRRSGLEVCQQLRQDNSSHTPILFLTALGDVEDRIQGFNAGGDDYLTKPFAFQEFEARVRALLRRKRAVKTTRLQFMDVTLDTVSRVVQRGGRDILLTGKEFALLEFLMYHPHQVMSRTTIAEHVWDLEADNYSNVINVYVSALRSKLCANGEPDIIATVRGTGYVLKEPL